MKALNLHGGVEEPAPESFLWPGGKRICVIFRVAFEGWSDGRWPGIGPMGNPLKPGFTDLNAIYWAEYGPRRGMRRLLQMLSEQEITATILVCGIMAERYPEIVRDIAERGHDIVAHSYAMDVMPAYLSEEEERQNIARTTELIERVAGMKPRGWISPRGTPSVNTARLLAEQGYAWHGDYLNDDLPFLIRFGEYSIVGAPGGMEVNDLPLSVRYGNPPRMMLEVFEDNLDSIRDDACGAEKIDVTVHAHVFGRPAGAWVFKRIMTITKNDPEIWIATRSGVADRLREVLGAENPPGVVAAE